MSDSFEKLQNRILSDAKLKADDIIREAEGKARSVVEQSRSQAQKETEAILARAKIEAEALRRSILSSKVRTNRLKVLDEKNRIVRAVLRSVEDQLSTISETSMFQDTVKKLVGEALEAVDTDEPIVRLGFRGTTTKDLDLDKILSKGARLVVEDKAIDELGGVVASDSKGRVVYNNSFRARIDRLDTQLLFLISSTIFGE